jgi:lysophospholipase L1-like esterase
MPALAGGNLGNIMPLGDSITEGTVPGSYRDPLASALTAAGYTFRFVGSNTSNSTTALVNSGNTHHEGHSGYTISAVSGRPGIDDNLASYIGTNQADPDYILLMIGTNDVDTGNSATAASRLSTLISHISNKSNGYRPDAHLIVASIVPINDATEELQVQSYNAGVLADVQAHQALGENVTFLDMHSYLTTADLGDKLHPNQGGYNKMAAAWMDGIQAVPEPTTALLLPLLGLLMRRRAR